MNAQCLFAATTSRHAIGWPPNTLNTPTYLPTGDSMNLSTDQQLVVDGCRSRSWTPLEMPTGRQQLPDWLLGLHIDWCRGVANAPRIKLKVRDGVHRWPGQTWERRPDGLYVAEHPDGRALAHYHKGRVSPRAMWRIFCADGKPFTHQWAVMADGQTLEDARAAGGSHLAKMLANDYLSAAQRTEYLGCRVETRLAFVTEESQGYGGSHFEIATAAGEPLVLRGPWHGGPPPGYAEVTTVDEQQRGAQNRRGWKPTPRWHQMGGSFGLCVSDDLLVRALAHYQPHVGLAHLPDNYGNRVEPYLPQWQGLKTDVYEVERQRSIRQEPAGEFWRVYWDARGSYCGQLRLPTYGIQDGVYDQPTDAERELVARQRRY